ncbi:MAG: hypothetical protein LUE23_09500 [Lachnospiraceae bacterium]|nr:hypothetical protein [Lachnospiraceae bacterium]
MKKRLTVIVIVAVFWATTALIWVIVYLTFTVCYPGKFNDRSNTDSIIGIIDGKLFQEHGNIVDSISDTADDELRHGDYLLNFLELYDDKIQVIYYCAESDGEITTDNIIEGLNWMADNNVEYICISISTHH